VDDRGAAVAAEADDAAAPEGVPAVRERADVEEAVSGRKFYAVYKRLRFPSGRTVRKYLSRRGDLTERLENRWITTDRGLAEDKARAFSRGPTKPWFVAELDEDELLERGRRRRGG